MSKSDPACTSELVRIGRSPLHGRGVFAARAIRAGEIVLVNVALPLGDGDVRPGDVIARYAYEWPLGGEGRAMALGEASLLNHAPSEAGRPVGVRGEATSNLEWQTDERDLCLRFQAKRDIREGEELLIDYGDEHPWDEARAAM